MIAVYATVLAFLLDTFDRLERRFAIDVGFGEAIPSRHIAWGVVGERDGWAQYLAGGRYFLIALPSYSWEYNWNIDDYGWARWDFLWSSKSGWRLIPRFEGHRLSRDMNNADCWVAPEGWKGW